MIAAGTLVDGPGAERPRVALIGLGEVGTIFARGLLNAGMAVTVSSHASSRAEAAALELGLALASGAPAVVAGAGLVLLTVTGDSLASVVDEIAPAIGEGTIVADLTAATPRQVKDAAAALGGRGSFVDVAIMGAVSLHGVRTPLLASGPAARRFAALLNGGGFNVQARDGSAVGDASALKLLRSVFAKGVDAVVVEAMIAAEALGLRAELVDQLADFDRAPLAQHIDMYLRTHPPHAARRLVEMEGAEAQLLALGLPSLTTRAAIERYRRTVALAAPYPLPRGPLDADAAAAWLLAAEQNTRPASPSSVEPIPEEAAA